MEERRSKIWAAYKKYRMIIRIIAAFVGVSLGISGCITFAKVYQNYHAAVWAAASAVFAIVFLRLHFLVRRDHERTISRETFVVTMWIGLLGFFGGLVGLITYLTLGITHHESGVDVKGFFIVCVWTFMTGKWGLFTLLSARKFKKTYFELDPLLRGLVENA